MNAREIARCIHREPFRPVRVRVTDGRTFNVVTRHSAVVTTWAVDLALAPGPDGIPTSTAHLRVEDVESIERLDLDGIA